MSKPAKLPKGALPFVYNPRNGRVQIATPAKLARKDDYDKPYFIPCESVEGPGESNVVTGVTGVGSQTADTQEENTEAKVPAPKADTAANSLIDKMLAEKDKDKLIAMGLNVEVKLTKNMKVETMHKHLEKKLKELGAL